MVLTTLFLLFPLYDILLKYNTWYDLGCSYAMREATVRLTADAFIEFGLDKLGYTYVNLDDWYVVSVRVCESRL